MEYIAVFAPLFAFLIAGLFGKQIGDRGAELITCSFVIAAAISSIFLFYNVILSDLENHSVMIVPVADWIVSGGFEASWTLRIDELSVIMMCVINIVSACVHVYSTGYMSHDKSRARFMAYLSLFTFAMLMLVTSDNLLQLFFGWEGVGVASYLLIGFWHHKDSANSAAIKAFVVNRIGDLGLILGIMTIFVIFGTISYDGIFSQAADKMHDSFNFFGYEIHAITLACILLFIGAMGKSAQLGLHTWLPDAMEGPTPVSALIHAATMVTAGVFLVARFSPLFEYAPEALMFVCVVGAATAFIAATIGMTQFDIKRVIAYSTMSQLGYMFFALGVSAYGAAMFHLVTHAFFKALLFLGAGSVIHAMSNEQDMRNMGGLWKKIPVTYGLMWIGGLALAGIPPLAGFYSKDIVLEAAYADHSWFGDFAFWAGIAAAFMTAFYTWRLMIMTFHGKCRAVKEVQNHIHESPRVMIYPLVILAIGAIISGYALSSYFVGSSSYEVVEIDENGNEYIDIRNKENFWGDSIYVKEENDTVEQAHHVDMWVKILPLIMGVTGIAFAYLFYMYLIRVPEIFARRFRPIYSLFYNKWFFDNIYRYIFVRNAFSFGKIFWKTGDERIINGFGPDGLAYMTNIFAKIYSKLQTGYIFHYAFVMMIGLVILVSWFFFGFSAD